MDEHRLDALAASLARSDGGRRSTIRVLGKWLRGSPPPRPADAVEPAVPDLNRRRLLLRGAAAAGAAVWIPPVIQSITLPAAGQGAGTPPPCTPSGQPCGQPADCCSGVCNSQGTCGCLPDGLASNCTGPADCCSGTCNPDSYCGCQPDGPTNTCFGPADCCSSNCNIDGYCGPLLPN